MDVEEKEDKILEEQSIDSSQYGICGCSSFRSVNSEVEPTISDIFYDTVVHPELYDTERDELDSSSTDRTRDTEEEINEKKIRPLVLSYTFGFNMQVPPINLSNNFRSEIFLVASHKGVIYNTNTHEMRFTGQHKNKIVAASVESTGRWLATSDVGPNSSIILTDMNNCETIHTIFNEEGDNGADVIGISPNGKYLVTLHTGVRFKIKMWLWSYGEIKPNDVYEYTGKKSYGMPVKISFHPNAQEYIMIVFDNAVLFIKWEDNCFSSPVTPKIIRKTGALTNCTMLEECHECFVSTNQGYIMIFGSATYSEQFHEHPVDQKKSFVKQIRISRCPIVCLEGISQKLACIDEQGVIRFFDNSVKLLFWVKNDITCDHLSFHLEERLYRLEDHFSFSNDFFTFTLPNAYEIQAPEDQTEAAQVLYKNIVPSEATLTREPFIIRKFIASSKNGNVYMVDIVDNTFIPLFDICDSEVSCIDCSDEMPHLVIAYKNGRVSLYNYENNQMVVSQKIISSLDTGELDYESEICAIKYSPQTLHLCLGKTNGEIWFLDTVLEPIDPSPFRCTIHKIVKISYSQDSKYCAYFDDNKTIFLMIFNAPYWRLMGKVRSHYKPITDLMFVGTTSPQLFTIGRDRYLVEYDLKVDIELEIILRMRIEQTAFPMCFLPFPAPPNAAEYIMYADNEQKYKMIHLETKMIRSITLGPSHGCYGELYINSMTILPKTKGKYMIFSNQTHIGIQILPPDGNPYKYIGVIGNPKLVGVAVSGDGKYAFTCGLDDTSVLMWKVHTGSLDLLQRMGGEELDPYYCLIEGGEKGWYFKEMKDLFCYMQIVHQGDSYQHQTFGDKMSLTELPDILRACGFYPTEFDIENIMNDIKYRDYAKTGKLRENIKFMEFVKLFINHRPAHGITVNELYENFRSLFRRRGSYRNESVDRHFFLSYLCEMGEPFTDSTLNKCLSVLIRRRQKEEVKEDNVYSYLPHHINFQTLSKEILGILQESVYEETQQLKFDEDNDLD